MHPCARGAGSALELPTKREGAERTIGKRQLTRTREPEALGSGDEATGRSAPRRCATLRRGPTGPRSAPTWRPKGSQPAEPICSASAAHCCPPQLPRPALPRPSSLPPPGSRWTRPPPAAAAGITARASKLQGVRSRVPGTGRELAAAGLGNLWLPCHQVPAEEGEGQGAAFPVPPARLDLRGLRLPGNSRAAAGPGSARGLLGAGPERFETTGLAKKLKKPWQMWTQIHCWNGCRWDKEMKGTCN